MTPEAFISVQNELPPRYVYEQPSVEASVVVARRFRVAARPGRRGVEAPTHGALDVSGPTFDTNTAAMLRRSSRVEE